MKTTYPYLIGLVVGVIVAYFLKLGKSKSATNVPATPTTPVVPVTPVTPVTPTNRSLISSTVLSGDHLSNLSLGGSARVGGQGVANH